MRILVTGGTGFIGTALLPMLRAAGHELRVLAQQPAAVTTEAEVITGTLPDAALCERLCAGIDTVIHLAGIAHVAANAADLERQNLDATLELARAARAGGVACFVFLSSSKAAWPAHSAYARCKAQAERELLAMQVPGHFTVHCVRPALVYGPGMRGNLAGLLRVLTRPRLPVFIGSTNALGMISVHDLCRALVLLLATQGPGGRIWELGDGESYTLDRIVYHVRATLGLRQPRVVLPRILLQPVALAATLLSPIYRSSFSMSTYKTLFVEQYRQNPDFARHTGFRPADTFYSCLPALLESGR